MELNTAYLNKCYYIAMLLQYKDQLKKEGFRTEPKKNFLVGGEAFTVDLYAESSEEQRVYLFRIDGKKENSKERETELNKLAARINAEPVIVDIKPPVEKQIIFDDFESILNEYFLTGDLPAELSCLSRKASVNALKVDEFVSADIDKTLITLTGSATIFATLQFGSDYECETGKGKILCEGFPITFSAGLDFDFNCKTVEYEIDTSGFKPPAEEIKHVPDNRNYMSRTKFDTEFKIYQELSESILNMICDAGFLFPYGEEIFTRDAKVNPKNFEELSQKAADSYSTANKSVNKYAPFIPKKLFEMLENVKNKCRLQIQWYGLIYGNGKDPFSAETRADEINNCCNRAAEIDNDRGIITDFLRNYIDTLDVRE
jgi:hypothetical protein